jgi:hypothetical protein
MLDWLRSFTTKLLIFETIVPALGIRLIVPATS